MAKIKRNKRMVRNQWVKDLKLRHHPERVRVDGSVLACYEVPKCGKPPLNALIKPDFERPAGIPVVVKS